MDGANGRARSVRQDLPVVIPPLPCSPPMPAAGKTYANCFLRSALPPSKRCAKSYDVIRLNVSMPGCQALISHDDFSISQWFPPGAATITQLRRWEGSARAAGAAALCWPPRGGSLPCRSNSQQ